MAWPYCYRVADENWKGKDSPHGQAKAYLKRIELKVIRDLSPLWDMYKDGVDLDTVQWAAH